MKPAVRSQRASTDIEDALAYYIGEAPHMGAVFVDALEKAVQQMERQTGIGSPRYAQELDIPRVRHWRLKGFPYALFYIEHDAFLDVIRLVHLSRDVPARLHDSD